MKGKVKKIDLLCMRGYFIRRFCDQIEFLLLIYLNQNIAHFALDNTAAHGQQKHTRQQFIGVDQTRTKRLLSPFLLCPRQDANSLCTCCSW
jgi:hypothetical protein